MTCAGAAPRDVRAQPVGRSRSGHDHRIEATTHGSSTSFSIGPEQTVSWRRTFRLGKGSHGLRLIGDLKP